MAIQLGDLKVGKIYLGDLQVSSGGANPNMDKTSISLAYIDSVFIKDFDDRATYKIVSDDSDIVEAVLNGEYIDISRGVSAIGNEVIEVSVTEEVAGFGESAPAVIVVTVLAVVDDDPITNNDFEANKQFNDGWEF